jgi:uncharacterized protein (TIGR00266 family)
MPKYLDKKISKKIDKKTDKQINKKKSLNHKGGVKSKLFTSNEITYIKNIEILSDNIFPEFKYDGNKGFQTLTIKLYPKSNNIIQHNAIGGFNLFGRRNNKSLSNIKLNIKESIFAEGGAMNYMTEDITLVSVAKNGFFSSIFRTLSDNSFFLSSIKNEGTVPGIVSLAPPNPGNIECFYIPPNRVFNIVSNSYIASTNNLKISSNAKFGGFLTGYGLFYTSIESVDNNPGLLWISSFGDLTEHIIEPGHKIRVDNGVILAFDMNVSFTTTIAGKGILSTLFSREGFVSLIQNNTSSNMIIYLQGRSVKSYNDYIANIAYKVCSETTPSEGFSISLT